MEIEIYQLQNQKFQTASDGKTLTIKGWVKSNRSSKTIGFLTINDGSSINSLQVVYKNDHQSWTTLTTISTGSAIIVTGTLKLTNQAQQPYELELQTLDYYNLAEPSYPIQKKAHSYEFLRQYAELRPRTDTFYAVFKIRNQLMFAIHQFFQSKNFLYLNSPLITANDAEGAGENFIVTTINNDQYQTDFFGKKASLTVSGQLNAEAYAQAFKRVYTFGPTFRAEKSHTTRHVAEFWMVEPECAFASLKDNIALAQDMLCYIINHVIEHCHAELSFLNKKLKSENEHHDDLFEKLNPLKAVNNFKTITYTEVIDLLLDAQKQGKVFVFNDIKWGIDLQSEHERYLCEEIMKAPTFVINYPQAIKAFYMKVNQDSVPNQKTVAAMDLLVPGVGELIGGSVREDSYQQLIENKKAFNLNQSDLEWYFNLRKFGYAPSAGFGLGLERLIMFVTGISNIRDVIAFPRTPNNLLF